LKAAVVEASDMVVPLQMRLCGMLVPISVDGGKARWVRLDTGCRTALQWVTAEVPDRCTRQMAIGLTELCIPQTRTRVVLGRQEFTDVPTGLHATAIFPGEGGLLGNGLLSGFSAVTIDARAGRVIFGSRHPIQ
jgi:hypothetical protein